MNKKRAVFIGLIIFVVLGYVSCTRFQRDFYIGKLPKQIDITETVFISDGFCGAAVFKLSDAALAAIKMQGLTFFETTLESRNVTENPWGVTEPSSRYGKWKETPFPPERGNEMPALAGLSCVESRQRDIVKPIQSHSAQNGSYYTETISGAELLVIPKLGIVVYSFFD